MSEPVSNTKTTAGGVDLGTTTSAHVKTFKGRGGNILMVEASLLMRFL
jgi:hypothetical protein